MFYQFSDVKLNNQSLHASWSAPAGAPGSAAAAGASSASGGRSGAHTMIWQSAPPEYSSCRAEQQSSSTQKQQWQAQSTH